MIEEVKHPVFKRKKADLVMNVIIYIKQALTGYKLKIDHFDEVKIIEGLPGDVIKPDDIRIIVGLGCPL